MSGDNNDSGSEDPLARLLFEPPTLVTDSLDFLLLVGVQCVLRCDPPAYVTSQRPDLKALARTRCFERQPKSQIIDTKLTSYLSYLHRKGRRSISDLHDYFAARSTAAGKFGHGCARQLNDSLLEHGLRPIRYDCYFLRQVNKEYFRGQQIRYPCNAIFPNTP